MTANTRVDYLTEAWYACSNDYETGEKTVAHEVSETRVVWRRWSVNRLVLRQVEILQVKLRAKQFRLIMRKHTRVDSVKSP